MKRFLICAILISVLASLLSCTRVNGEGNDTPPSTFTLTAIVWEVGERIEVEVIESDYAFGIYWVITSEKTAFFDENGAKISLADIKVGDRIEITYNGQTMLSYPPQIVALSVRIVGNSAD